MPNTQLLFYILSPYLTENVLSQLQRKAGNVRINATLRRIRITIYCRAKARSVTYSDYVSVALITQRTEAPAPYYIITCGLSGGTIDISPHYLIELRGFGKKIIEHKLICSTAFV